MSNRIVYTFDENQNITSQEVDENYVLGDRQTFDLGGHVRPIWSDGVAEGATVEEIAVLETETTVSTEAITTSNLIRKANVSACVLLGGTSTQPNLVGIQIHQQDYIGDGVTNTYDVTAPFIINQLTRTNIRGIIKRVSDGAIIAYSNISGLTINSGYGTNTINVTMSSTPSVGDLVEFTVFGENEDVNANSTLIFTTGYDNSVNAIASISNSHHGIVFAGAGHNSLLGGSYNRAWGSFNTTIGQGIWIGRTNNDSYACFGLGRGMEIDGDFSGGFGSNLKVNGTASYWFGRDSEIDEKNDSVGFGRKGQVDFSSSFVLSGGRSSDTINGQHQFHKIILNRETTDETEQFMRDATGQTSFDIPNNSAYTITISLVGLSDDFTKSKSFHGVYNLVKDAGGTTRINGLTTDVAIPSVGGYGLPVYSADVRAISGKLGVRVTGHTGENVRWSGTIDLTQVKY